MKTGYIKGKMGSITPYHSIMLFFVILLSVFYQPSATGIEANQTVGLFIDASEASAKKIPETMFGIFFEEINHAGAGGLWAELVSNRGFEAGGPNIPSNIDPWLVIGDESSIIVSTDRSSCFDRNKIALRIDVLCDHEGTNICPAGGVGVYNPGYWGMNIEEGKTYKLVFYTRSSGPLNVSASLTGSNGLKTLATVNIVASDVSNWTKMEATLEAKGTDANSRLQLTTTKKGVIWFDQVSLMPTDTYKGHGFRNDLFEMMKNLRPAFIRFPEDLGALPVWVFNNGVSHNDQVDTSDVLPFVKEILDGLEFAKGDPQSKWGSVRAAMGHPEPFDLRYVAVGNEDCGKKNYLGNYLKFYSAIKSAYPDIKIISNCDGSSQPLDHPADLYDYHIYSSAKDVFASAQKFDQAPRKGPKVFVSEYAVTGNDAGKGSLLAALAEAGFLIGLEKNSDAIEMASYAPLFVNTNDRTWNPDAIVFDSSQAYGTPSYWMQHFFRESNGATLLNATLQSNPTSSLIASAITWKDTEGKKYLKIKVVNFGSNSVTLQVSINGLEVNSLQSIGSTKTELTSINSMDENSFQVPNKVVPVKSHLDDVGEQMDIVLSPHSLTSLDLLINTNSIRIVGPDTTVDKSSY
ncbi:Non-reducing end alpha-L-arabinofuranosidase [Handroanthus impetiginosus]|uniref:non-reducing end alpha-L-arabinofuranosidase n=1 Tax=Handroanthus impetiginosus TaxID=429701 RepID=A0A2G9HMW3_9LAMI|nr:Non-reducing end alpha-L-arabinofuranosidase [Handroanthus impetiginosus]